MPEHQHHEPHHEFETEREEPRPSTLVGYGLAIAVVFWGSVIVMISIFRTTTDELVYSRQLSRPSPALQVLRAEEEDKLSTYGWANKDKQLVHIPIERAMRLLAEEPQK